MSAVQRAKPLTSRPEFLWAGLLVAIFPVLRWYIDRLNDGSDEPLGLLSLGLACSFILRERKRVHAEEQKVLKCARELSQKHLWWSVFFLACYLLSLPVLPPLLRAVPALMTLACFSGLGGVRRLGDQRNARNGSLGIIFLLVLSLPIIASLQFYLGYPLRLTTAECARFFLNILGQEVTRDGVQLFIKQSVVNVDPPCSGIRTLWNASVLASALAALYRLSALKTILLFALSTMLCLVANSLRATLLFFPESGLFSWPEWSHEGLGLLIYALCVWLLLRSANFLNQKPARSCKRRQRTPCCAKRRVSLTPHRSLLALALLCILYQLITPHIDLTKKREARVITPPSLTHYRGQLLTPIPHSPLEESFQKNFPGQLASYSFQNERGSHQLIIRTVNQATRKLHPSSHCLRAMGFTLGRPVLIRDAYEEAWVEYPATKKGRNFLVRERVISLDDSSLSPAPSWTEVSAWYWSALQNPDGGPWRAETLIIHQPFTLDASKLHHSLGGSL